MDGSVIRPTNAVAAHSGDLSNLSPVTTTMPLITSDGDLESVVECPVCLVIPRSLPIPCCPAGHIMCRPCR